MVIRVDISSLPENLKSVIIDDIDIAYRRQYNSKNHDEDISPQIDNDRNVLILDDDKSHLKKIERMIKDILIKRRIDDYVVIQDAKEKNNIVILKRHHGEQLGIYHCRHCGMEFENEIQLSAHQRLHFFI
ncbi:MAG: hypothetical protein WCF23_05215 [Candidatus Nitrosopolaris sp.]